ncbi:MAG: hypothetical protein ACRDH5_00050, partial [bacterium]
MAEQTPAEKPEQWSGIGEQLFAGFINAWVKSDASKTVVTVAADVIGGVLGAAITAMTPVGIGLAKGIANSENLVAPALSEMAAAAVSDMFNVDVPSSAFDGGISQGGRGDAASALGAGLIKQLLGEATTLKPDDAAAARYVTFVVNMALEGWYQKWFFEFLTSLIPQLDIGKIENFGSLDDKMAAALGLGRLTRRVLSPIVDATISTPLEWHVNKTYTPRLLPPSEAIQWDVAGFMKPGELGEELARQGYSPDRIAALVNNHLKKLSVDDLDLLVRVGRMPKNRAIQYLREQGYDQFTAEDKFELEHVRRIAAFERRLADAALTAFADGRLERFELHDFVDGITIDSQERAQLVELAEARRALRAQPLSSSEARRLAQKLIVSVSDYRHALEREGRTPEAVLALELELRQDMDATRALEALRAEQAAERAAEETARGVE